jgi:hypothetical protein
MEPSADMTEIIDSGRVVRLGCYDCDRSDFDFLTREELAAAVAAGGEGGVLMNIENNPRARRLADLFDHLLNKGRNRAFMDAYNALPATDAAAFHRGYEAAHNAFTSAIEAYVLQPPARPRLPRLRFVPLADDNEEVVE